MNMKQANGQVIKEPGRSQASLGKKKWAIVNPLKKEAGIMGLESSDTMLE